MSIRYYEATVWAGEDEGTIEIGLRAVDDPAEEAKDAFSMEDVRFGPAPEGTEMKESYKLVMKRR